MGFWNRIKDVLVSGPTAAAKNQRHEDAAERAAEEQAKNPPPTPAPKADIPPPVEVPPVQAPQPPASDPTPTDVPVSEQAEPEYRTYTVKAGDTLSEIAASFGVDWHEMARLNELENPDLILPGQVFKVPND